MTDKHSSWLAHLFQNVKKKKKKKKKNPPKRKNVYQTLKSQTRQ